MRLHVKQFAAVSSLAALEASRQPVFLLLTASCVLFIGLMPLLITHVLDESSRIVRDSALALHFMSGLVLGAYAAGAALTAELRRGTVASVLSKPVDRAVFFLAKFTGVAVIMTGFSAAAAIATLLSARTASVNFTFDAWGAGPLFAAVGVAFAVAGLQNFFLQRPFVSRAFGLLMATLPLALLASALVDNGEAMGRAGAPLDWTILRASALVALAILVLTAFAVSLATRLDVVPTLTLCSVLLLIGLMSDYLFGRLAAQSAPAAFLHRYLPNWQHYWAVDALNAGGIPWVYVGQVALYTALYLAAILGAGIVAFHRMEIR